MSKLTEPITITLHGSELQTIFELLGSSENSITYGVGWTLARSPSLLSRVSERIGAKPGSFEHVRLQQHSEHGGYTDIELLGATHHAVIEAKRGWWLPKPDQWDTYLPRFESEKRTWRRFVAMSDCTAEYASQRLPTAHGGIAVIYLGWRDIAGLCIGAGRSYSEKLLLNDLRGYLGKVATMQDVESNMVYVVSLGSGVPEGGVVSWIEIVRDHGIYFHPVGGRWPKEPPNYLAFRYGGQLQTVHHVESYVVSTDARDVEGLPPNWDWLEPRTVPGTGAHYVYRLGPAIMPARVVKAGPRVQQSNRVSVMLDLLLTCDTISEALDKTEERRAGRSGRR